ncbi:MAG: hypothetical protein K8R36_20145 [Planctomycetales bacterium]|nr:hypothetical protein [Planctomycetales bacterium]
MPEPPPPFEPSRLLATPIRDLKLTIAGTLLEPVLARFEAELREAGIVRLTPRFYLSTEWGVPFPAARNGARRQLRLQAL